MMVVKSRILIELFSISMTLSVIINRLVKLQFKEEYNFFNEYGFSQERLCVTRWVTARQAAYMINVKLYRG